jgi:hypothetical protein
MTGLGLVITQPPWALDRIVGTAIVPRADGFRAL